MNCEQVEVLLSAYLDNALAPEERKGVAAHLETCSQCGATLAELRRNDYLLSQLPRVAPSPALRNRVFSSPEYLELTGTFDASSTGTTPHSQQHTRRDRPGRPQLVALPGGRSRNRDTSAFSPASTQQPTRQQPAIRRPRRGSSPTLRVMYAAIAAAVLLTIGVGSYIGWNLMQPARQASTGAITPPAGLQQQGPLAAGMHLVFLRDGTLMSAPADGSTAAVPLTPKGITVAANWAVSSPLPGRAAGDLLAYIDLQKATVHTIRSDGQSDTVIAQPLLKAGVQPSSVWDTDTGAAILNSLAWSPNSSMLALVADPTNSGATSLYIYSTGTGSVQKVSLPLKGSVSHPTWSPDGMRVAFLLTANGVTSILDYNTQNHGLLTITDGMYKSTANSGDAVLTFAWSPDSDTPALTWSVGAAGHVHSIWTRRVGVSSDITPRLLAMGDYAQALFSPNGHGGVGSWLLVSTTAGRMGLWRADITDFSPVALVSGVQISFAQWSPNGMMIDYLQAGTSNVGALHLVNVTTGRDTLVASGVAGAPDPAWSTNGQKLAYSTGTQTMVVNVQTGQKPLSLNLHGPASTFIWSATSPNQLVVSLGDGQSGIFLVDTRHNTSKQVDTKDTSGPIAWSQVP